MTTASEPLFAWANGDSCGASARSLLSLADASRVLRIPAGRTIFRKGDAANGCFLVLDGALKVVFPTASGQETLLAILGKGDLVGEMALIDGLPRSATVTAVRASMLRHISATIFDRLSRADFELARHLLRVMAARLRQRNEAHALQQAPLRVRLARTLLHLGERFGEDLPDGRTLIRLKVSQADLGQMAGAARENVNRQLTEWRRDRLLSRISGYYCLDDRETITRLGKAC
ncbi:MAG TPA: Crp/Fnr family transcriptional regulator [Hyphomicrobiaceae bacterium]|nr:Crp/Fnr family transcriptional regulator [Hyphomicrobiaceae bacterium]